MAKRFLLADDHAVIRTGIKSLLGGIYSDAIIDEAANGSTVLEKTAAHTYDLILLDLQIPGTDTISLIEQLTQSIPDSPILIFSMSTEQVYGRRVLKAGAMGFVSKDASLDVLKNAIDRVLHKRKYMSDDLVQQLADTSRMPYSDNPFTTLSKRELEITQCLLQGQSLGEIAKALDIHISTVGTFKARVFHKLQVNSVYDIKELSTVYPLVK